ncbi:MAG TPA: calcium-binding protein, partial [Planctomycetaceae bacterium]|nr:calcium-binding protein [Planctomycetaceae bacterium]
LYGGTGLDFLYGGGGNDSLWDRDGQPLASGIGVPEDEEWLQYARSTDRIWYYGATDADDVITVDYVTEPGVLGDHHLITRLTENNGRFTFDAQVRLDFGATDADGQPIWNPNDIVYSVAEINGATDEEERELVRRDFELSGNVLPPEGDYLAIVIDAQGGDDQVYVGPTVQRSVWVAGGDGNDRIEFAAGSAILVDLADAGDRNEVPGDPTDVSRAYSLSPVLGDSETSPTTRSTIWTDLTLDHPDDVDWYRFALDRTPSEGAQLILDSLAESDAIEFQLYSMSQDGEIEFVRSATPVDQGTNPADPAKPSRSSMNIDDLKEGVYWIRTRSTARIPTQYNLAIDLIDIAPGGTDTVDLGLAPSAVRRDVLVGGAGHDVLQGGPGEDWVIGGPGNDVLSGGIDQEAGDLILGEAGDDLLQVIPTDPNGVSGIRTDLLTLTDEFEGGDGYDRILYLGGDTDAFGRPVPDSVALDYLASENRFLLRQRVWDTANQEFLVDGDGFAMWETTYRTRGVEATWFDLGDGDDELRLDVGYQFPLPGGGTDDSRTFGIAAGDRQQGADAANFVILAGNGNDRIFGSPYADRIDGGEGIDLIVGGAGSDDIAGNAGSDLLVGNQTNDGVILFDVLEVATRDGVSVRNDSVNNATSIDFSQGGRVDGLTFQDGDRGDWYIVPVPTSGGTVTDRDFRVDFLEPVSKGLFENPNFVEPTLQVYPAVLDPT